MDPASRREQLLDIGLRLLETRPLEELSIELLADQAGISRGLLYHYFGNKQDFHLAVVRRAADEVIALTAPRDIPDPLEQLVASVGAYVDYVVDHLDGYVSLVRAAAAGNQSLRAVYDDARSALIDRIFEATDPERLADLGVHDTPAVRLLARSWGALVEDSVIAWAHDRAGLSREDLLDRLVGALVSMVVDL